MKDAVQRKWRRAAPGAILAAAILCAPDCGAMTLREIADAARRLASPLMEHVTSWWRRTSWEPHLEEAGTVIVIRQAEGLERMNLPGGMYPAPTRFADMDFAIVSFDADGEDEDAPAALPPLALAESSAVSGVSARSAPEPGTRWERAVWWRRRRFSPAESKYRFTLRLR